VKLVARYFAPRPVSARAAGSTSCQPEPTASPAFGAYLRLPAGICHATGFYVLTLAGDRICAMTRFEASVLAVVRANRDRFRSR